VDGLNSNLNLNGAAAPSVIPGLGEWSPAGVPSTRAKKRMRWVVPLLLVAVAAVVTLFGWWVWSVLQGG